MAAQTDDWAELPLRMRKAGVPMAAPEIEALFADPGRILVATSRDLVGWLGRLDDWYVCILKAIADHAGEAVPQAFADAALACGNLDQLVRDELRGRADDAREER